MPVSRERLHWLVRPTLIAINVVAASALLGTAILIWKEATWTNAEAPRDPQAAFLHGTIGTELIPLPVAHALPRLFPSYFQPDGQAGGDWIEQFGFMRKATGPANDDLPLGFVVSHFRPGSAAPSPVPFVGFSCALCHTTAIRIAENEPAKLVNGPGSVSLNLFAWLDALQAALLARQPVQPGGAAGDNSQPPYQMTIATIQEAYREATGKSISLPERLAISLWLRQFRTRLEAGLPRFDEPFGKGLSRNPEVTPTGPTRT